MSLKATPFPSVPEETARVARAAFPKGAPWIDLRERKWIKARGRQRTDSTHILAAIRSLNHLEHVGRTFQRALNTVAAMEPDWMRARLQDEWSEWPAAYERRLDEYRLPKGESARTQMAVQIGLDGHALLDALEADPDLAYLRNAPAIKTLRRV